MFFRKNACKYFQFGNVSGCDPELQNGESKLEMTELQHDLTFQRRFCAVSLAFINTIKLDKRATKSQREKECYNTQNKNMAI